MSFENTSPFWMVVFPVVLVPGFAEDGRDVVVVLGDDLAFRSGLDGVDEEAFALFFSGAVNGQFLWIIGSSFSSCRQRDLTTVPEGHYRICI